MFNYETQLKPDEVNWAFFLAHGSSLLYELSQLRSKLHISPTRPLIFVCHTLGGLVLKQVL